MSEIKIGKRVVKVGDAKRIDGVYVRVSEGYGNFRAVLEGHSVCGGGRGATPQEAADAALKTYRACAGRVRRNAVAEVSLRERQIERAKRDFVRQMKRLKCALVLAKAEVPKAEQRAAKAKAALR